MKSFRSALCVSMSELMRNPLQIKRDAGMHPIVVLNHHKPVFYILDPVLYKTILKKLDDIFLAELVNARLKMNEQAIEFDVDETAKDQASPAILPVEVSPHPTR